MRIGIFGTGAFGLALSSILTDNNHDITMWTKFTEEKKLLDTEKTNKYLLPGYYIKDNIKITNNYLDCINEMDLIIIALPVSFIKELLVNIKEYINNNHIVIVSKGITDDMQLPYELVRRNLNTDNFSVLGGPTFASDIIKKEPLAFTLGYNSEGTKQIVTTAFKNNYVKIETTKDLKGVELSGAIKNVYAIFSGILDGMKVTTSTKALFYKDSIYDLTYIIDSLGGKAITAISYAGLGDFLLTCTDSNSRNYTFGKIIGENKSKEKVEKYLKETTVEGYHTLKSLQRLLKSKNIKVKIIHELDKIINENEDTSNILNILI